MLHALWILQYYLVYMAPITNWQIALARSCPPTDVLISIITIRLFLCLTLGKERAFAYQ